MKNKLFISYLLSFLALVLLPLTLIGIVITTSYSRSAQTQYLEAQRLMLRTVSEQLDSYMELPVDISSKLAQLRGYQRFHVATAFTPYERQDSVYEISSYLNGLIRNEICTNFCVYYEETDTVISDAGSTYSFSGYYDAVLNYQGMDGADFLRWLRSVDSIGYSGVLTAQGGQRYFCMAQILPSSYLHRTTYLLSFFNISRLQTELEGKLSPDTYYCVRTAEQVPVVSNLPENFQAGAANVKIDGIRCLAFSETSSTTWMEYLFYVPEAVVLESLLDFQRLFWLVFGLVLVSGIVFSFAAAFRRYAPIRQLFAQVFPEANSDQADFHLMSQRLTEISRQEKDYANEIQAQWRKLRNQALTQILTTANLDMQKLRLLIEEYNLQFPYPRFSVAIVCGCTADQWDLPNVTVCPFPLSSYCALIVNDSASFPAREQVEDSLRSIQNVTPGMQFSISSPCDSLQELHQRFQEALLHLPDNAGFCERNGAGGFSEFQYPMDRELEILNELCAGNYGECERLLTELYRQHQSLPESVQRCFLHRAAATVCHVYRALETSDKRPLQYLEETLSCTAAPEEGFQALLALCRSVAALSGQPPKAKNKQVVDAIIQYVQQHYSDPNLSLNTVAAAFHVSYYYLSHIFNEEVQQSFSSLLNLCRIEQAKQMLVQSSRPAQEIAVAVGYTNNSTFFRTFRKMTGLTPNEYRTRQHEKSF